MRYLLICLVALTLFSCKEAEVTEFQYTTVTMMGKTIMKVSQEKVTVDFSGRGEPTHFERETKDTEWIALMSSLKDVDLDKVNGLEAPSNKRATDAAPFASFSFVTPDSTYKSASFDHKNPNEMLMPLMQEFLKVQEENKN
ncbi:MAG: hypothetical protein ABJG68_10710 [Crocinitomicaceae bacterium]